MPRSRTTAATDDRRATRTLRPKRRLRKRAILAIASPFLILIALQAFWGMWAQHRVDAHLDNLHAAGEPVYPADFDVPVPPPGQNAADDLIKAGKAVAASAELKEYERVTAFYLVGPPLLDGEREQIARAVSANRPSLDLITAASRKPLVRWPGRLDDDPLYRSLDWLNDLRECAILLKADVLLAHHEGRDADSLQRVRETLAMADAIDRHPMWVPHAVSIGIVWMAAELLQDIAPDLRVDEPGGADRSTIETLIKTLLDDQRPRASFLRALQGERKDHYLQSLELYDSPLDLGYGPHVSNALRPLNRFISRPFVMSAAELTLRFDTEAIDTLRRSTNLPAARQTGAASKLLDDIERQRSWNYLAAFCATSWDRSFENEYGVTCERRLAAVALAMRLYAIDHPGDRPRSLHSLVPNYLPLVPSDPMAADGRELHYLPRTNDPVVYGVGKDGRDDAAAELISPGTRWTRSDQGEPIPLWHTQDRVMHLERQPRFLPPFRKDPTGRLIRGYRYQGLFGRLTSTQPSK